MNSIENYIKEHLTEKRLKHTYAVRDLAVALAEKHKADKDKTAVASLFHDMCRGKNFTKEVLNDYVRKFGLDEKYIDNFSLAHSKVAAELMKRDFGITDEEIINAVSFHTTGRPNMSVVEKIVFIADATEPGRTYEGADSLRRLAFQDLDKACLAAMNNTIEYIKKKNLYLDEESVLARDYLLEKENFDG